MSEKPRRKQTARKTTGSHATFNARMSPSTTYNDPFFSSRHVQNRLKNGAARVNRPKPKSILNRPSSNGAGAASPPAPVPSTSTSPSPSSLDVPLSFTFTADNPAVDPAVLTSKALIKRRPAVGVLDKPISVCTRFATWLENQSCVRDDVLLGAIERDGDHFLRLAKATVVFDDALRGHVPSTTMNGAQRPLGEHALTLRAFSQLLQFKISQDSLSEELETAVLRDGEPLLRLALFCLDFDQAIRGGMC